jgi:monofunctional biosynthetic peptidoglycan transglycosylase
MKFLLLMSMVFVLITNSPNSKIDFGKNKDGNNWNVVNDGVMGGLSKGSSTLTEDSILFTGEVSLDNNGGFSSLRSSFSNKDLASYKKVKIRYRSEGISLAMTLSLSRRWYVPNYKMSLEGTKGNWKTITLNLADFEKYRIGKPMGETLDQQAQAEIIRFGFITDEKKYGAFEFEIDYIEFLP